MSGVLITIVFFISLGIVGIGLWWLGFRIWPGRPQPHPEPTADLGSVALPPELPAPVRRFYAAIAPADALPRIESAALWGRAHLGLVVGGRRVWVPVTWRQRFLAGQAFYWSATVRWFRLPFGQGYDFFRDGHGEFGFGRSVARGPQLDQAENVRLWAEAVWMPSVWLSDPRTRWLADDGAGMQVADADRAWLLAPGLDGARDAERLEVRFDPRTGLIERIVGRRFRGASDAELTAWTVTCSDWTAFRGVRIPARLRLSWEETVYADLYVDGVEYNVAVTIQ